MRTEPTSAFRASLTQHSLALAACVFLTQRRISRLRSFKGTDLSSFQTAPKLLCADSVEKLGFWGNSRILFVAQADWSALARGGAQVRKTALLSPLSLSGWQSKLTFADPAILPEKHDLPIEAFFKKICPNSKFAGHSELLLQMREWLVWMAPT
ncbi:hypothetical protein OCA8868_01736 [Octadecabacter ascidiaceicola]|uniref:Uncharacterized protein n=1 Tax=Octadecabacter ascidiaceicola TaxID=1655543 RepID=A0A238K5M7_9RHOB|nr:hypothetical protein OCA8868_01736 [Octadecabacter ascidiaceicola]